MAASLTSRTLARPAFEIAFEPPAFLRAMLAFEAALARAEAAEGLIPDASARAIAAACGSVSFDVEALVGEAKRNGTLVVPFVKALRAQVQRVLPDAAAHVHFGSTTQDVLDTAMALCLRECLDEADRSLEAAVRALAARAREHRATPMAGRTLMQPAIPITAGLKIARWAAALAHDRERLADAQVEGLAVQLGGPVGALEALGAKGPAVRHRVAMELGLADVPEWQSHRNDWIDLLDRIGLVVLTAGKIALDLSLLGQAEVGEMREAPPEEGVGGSSAMPHKRNPVGCLHAIAAATRMPGLLAIVHAGAISPHERALGEWQAELETVPEIAGALGRALDFLDLVAGSLVVDPERMRANLGGCGPAAAAPLEAVDELLAGLSPYLT
jgi:3-carboxy-cis,cis-muconate cycloisomerase